MRQSAQTLMVALALLIAGDAGAWPDFEPQTGVVTRVVDGDTFWLRFPEAPGREGRIEYRANLKGVDAPGRGESECEADRIEAITRGLLEGETVWVSWDSGDKRTADGRLLVYIAHRDDHTADLNGLYIAHGWAWVPRRYEADRKALYLELEADARAAGRGIWGGGCPPDVADPPDGGIDVRRETDALRV